MLRSSFERWMAGGGFKILLMIFVSPSTTEGFDGENTLDKNNGV